MLDSCIMTLAYIVAIFLAIGGFIMGVEKIGAGPMVFLVIIGIVVIAALFRIQSEAFLKKEIKEDFRMDHPELETFREVLSDPAYSDLKRDVVLFVNGFKRKHGYFPSHRNEEFVEYFSEKFPSIIFFYKLLWVAILAESEADVSDKKSIAREYVWAFYRLREDDDEHMKLYQFADEGGQQDIFRPKPYFDSYRIFHILVERYFSDIDLRESRELLREAYDEYWEQEKKNKLQKIRERYIEPPEQLS